MEVRSKTPVIETMSIQRRTTQKHQTTTAFSMTNIVEIKRITNGCDVIEPVFNTNFYVNHTTTTIADRRRIHQSKRFTSAGPPHQPPFTRSGTIIFPSLADWWKMKTGGVLTNHRTPTRHSAYIRTPSTNLSVLYTEVGLTGISCSGQMAVRLTTTSVLSLTGHILYYHIYIYICVCV